MKPNHFLRVGLPIIIGSVLAIVALLVWMNSLEQSSDRSGAASALHPVQESPALALQLTDQRFRRGGFGNVLLVSAEIKNTSAYGVIDPVVSCEVRGASGTVIDSPTKQIFQPIPAGQAIRLREENFGRMNPQATTIYCSVEEAKLAWPYSTQPLPSGE